MVVLVVLGWKSLRSCRAERRLATVADWKGPLIARLAAEAAKVKRVIVARGLVVD